MLAEISNLPSLNDLLEINPSLKGVFWDMDGTIFNTENSHHHAIHQLITDLSPQNEQHLLPNAEQLKSRFMGLHDQHVFSELQKELEFLKSWNDITFMKKKEEYFRQTLQSQKDHSKMLLPHIKQLIMELHHKKYHLSLVTSAEKESADFLLNFFNLEKYFKFKLTRNDCGDKVKPHPWPYLKTLQESKLSAHEVLVLEDSPAGIKSANAARLMVLKAHWYL
jgi:HAD superfamily hydrolase (TIGR01509 family)